MNEERTIKFKSKRFAVRIVKLYNYLCNEKKEYVLSKQILRSGTSIGANIAESECAISRKDFIAKVYIALKECVETIYWLDLLYETNYIDNAMYNSMKNDCEEMRKMMSSTTKTMNSPNTQTTELNTPNSKPQTLNSKLNPQNSTLMKRGEVE
jgi:four helix bundle protein